MNIQELRKKVMEITEIGLDFMEGKEKIDIDTVINEVLTVENFGYITTKLGECVVITVKEYPSNYIFGSSVITETFKKLTEKLSADEVTTLINEGFTFKITKEISSNMRKYNRIQFFPN